jgi:uncharacterized Fe-S center protein
MGEKNWMNKVVYFKGAKDLSKALGFFDLSIFENKSVLVKLHMGEEKNKYFIRPSFVKSVINAMLKQHSIPFLYDTTVLYESPRKNIEGYKQVAFAHGFHENNIGCPLVIDDEGVAVIVEGYEFEVGKTLYDSSHVIGLSHVKGHVATGMGGAIKNFGMGGVTRTSKKMMHHGSKPEFNEDNCQLCGICAEVCPFHAITVDADSWMVNEQSCFGCGVCVDNCSYDALSFVKDNLQYLIASAMKACISNKQMLFINDVNRIVDSCDCDPYAKTLLSPDVGYCIASDPVAVDHASLELIHEVKKDVFQKTFHIDPYKQIQFGEEIGLGSREYELIRL